MLDTVTIKLASSLRIRLPGRQKLNVVPGMKIWADSSGETLEKAEFSLPKVLFGHNGCVLERQREIDAAFAKCADVLSGIARIPDVSKWQPRRVDMAWNFDLPARSLIIAHASLRMPGILRGATLHNGEEGVSWRGAKSHKMLTQKKTSNSCIRSDGFLATNGMKLSFRKTRVRTRASIVVLPDRC